jgi:hypothetical protein
MSGTSGIENPEFNCPSGTWDRCRDSRPSDESLGYYQTSLRDEKTHQTIRRASGESLDRFHIPLWADSLETKPTFMKLLHLLAVISLGLTCGCSALDLSKAKSLWPAGAEKPQQPSSIVAIWSEGVVHQPGVTPARGYAGRLIFYDAAGTKPVKVDGTLSVYAFDEGGRGKADAKPDRKYVFTPEQLSRRYDPVKVGPAYAVWIPWDEAGGPRKDISLIVRFAPRTGPLVVGEMTRLVLNGAAPANPEGSNTTHGQNATTAADSMVRPASYETPTVNPPNTLPGSERTQGGMRSTTIQLPDDMVRRLHQRRADSLAIPQQRRTDSQSIPRQTASAAGVLPSPATPNYPAPGASQASRHWAPPGVHSSRVQSRVPGVPIAPLNRDHGALPPHPAGPPSRLEPQPPEGPLPADASTWPDAGSPRN